MRKKTATPEEVWALLRESQKTSDKLHKKSAKETQELRELQRKSVKETQELRCVKVFYYNSIIGGILRKKHATPEEVWALLRESQKTSDKLHKKSAKETQELRELQKETDRQMKETDKQFKELKEFLKEQSIKLDKANGNFNNKWGAFIEKLIAGDLVSLLKEQGIVVRRMKARKGLYRDDGSTLGEYDLIAYSYDSVVVVTEVKSTLTKGKVDKFVTNLKKYKEHGEVNSNAKIFGALGFLETEDGSVEYAEKKGFFVIRSPEGELNISKIINSKGFKPKVF